MQVLLFLFILLVPLSTYAVDITDCGTLSTPNAAYVLQNNVTSNGTCFTVTESGITLDLNGNTVTYDNAAPVSITNGGFESTLAGTWDTSGSENSTRSPGTYLESTLYEGSYALRIATPTVNQQAQSVGSFTLQANTTYSISGMVYNQVSDDVILSIELNGTAIVASLTGRTWRGFQYIYAQFTTDGSLPDYKINLKVTNATGASAGYVYFDDIRIQQSAHYGVYGAINYKRPPTVTNGTIIQGQAHGDFSHAVNNDEGITLGGEISHLNINVNGNSSKAITLYYITNMDIHGNTISSTVDTIKSRDNSDGALIHIYYPCSNGSVHDNVINSGIQNGVYAKSDGTNQRIAIYNNNITLQSKYTNDFAIIGDRSNIYSNVINCGSGNNNCRGILSSGDGGAIYNNTVSVQHKLNNQEYGGCGGYAYGIQLEETAQNIEVFGNTVTANADDCDAVAFRPLGINATGYDGNYVHDNTFSALAVNGSSNIASSIMCMETYKEHVTISGNILDTNSNWLRIDGINVDESTLGRSFAMDNNTFKLTTPKSVSYYPLLSKTYNDGSEHPRNVSLTNNIYPSQEIKDEIEYGFRSVSLGFVQDTFAYNVSIYGAIMQERNRHRIRSIVNRGE